MGDGNVKLLMFSDIEGCQKYNLVGKEGNKGTFEQSGFLCSAAFYSEITKRLDSDPNLNIAFLGDYFDQGMGVYDSINGMNGLLDNFNKDGKERVFVILGNRDVNKLRFCFELANKGIVGLEKDNRWEAGFGNFFDNLNGKTDVALANCILFHSMGAKIDMNTNSNNHEPDAKLIGLHSFLPSSLSYEKKQDSKLALKYLKVSLGIILKDEEETPNALDILGFFKKCKLAHVFDGPGGKVLLAHGGGFDSDAFFDEAYVNSFGEGMTDEISPDKYHTTMEQFRRILSGSAPAMKGGFDRKKANKAGNEISRQNMLNMLNMTTSMQKKEQSSLPLSESSQALDQSPSALDQSPSALDQSSPITPSKQVEKSVDAYNNLLQRVINEITRENKTFTWRFVLLQALGLKPDKEDARYKSLIQSCSQDGCSGPNPILTSDPNSSNLAKILKDSGITHVSYGHKPICFPIPVIYKRNGIDGVTFISNDTSNGNRKIEEVGDNTAIGTMVIFDPTGDQSKVQSKIEPVQYENKVGTYSAMYDPLTFKTTPFYEPEDGVNVLKYGDSKVVFNKKGDYDQLKFEGIAPASNTVDPPTSSDMPDSGGRRRSRNRKYNTKKRGSKRLSKRTKRNKHHTKRSRKQRKH
jgi:hypothetical protein